MEKIGEWLNAQKKEINFHEKDNHMPQGRNEEYAYRLLSNYSLNFTKLENKRILEIGSGTRGAIYYLNEKNMNIGIEPMPLHKLISLQKWKKSFLVRGMGEFLGIKDECIDIIICHNVIDHTILPKKLLEESHRILKQDGVMLIGTHILHNKYKNFRWFINKIDTTHPHHFIKDELYQAVRKWFSIDNEKIILGLGDNQGVLNHIKNKKFKIAAGNLLLNWIQISCVKKD